MGHQWQYPLTGTYSIDEYSENARKTDRKTAQQKQTVDGKDKKLYCLYQQNLAKKKNYFY